MRPADGPAATAAAARRWAGFALDRPLVMGIINVTPDSFSDGGRFGDTEQAIAHGRALAEDGADIVDIGGESSRPGAAPLGEAEEQARVLPVVEALARDGICVSIDTYHAGTMVRALDAGARIVNDITALTGDKGSLDVVVRARCPVVMMHMAGTPATMQAAPAYRDVVTDVHGYLTARLAAAVGAGLPVDRVAIDPGIGFGKTVDHNLELLRRLPVLAGLGRPILVGTSRKSMIARLSRNEPPDRRLGGSLALALAAVAAGAAIIRVHDVAETVQALTLWRALQRR
ncbi:MAG: dihydropteroate synthase [Azospirillaceae bacterium]